MDIKLEKALLIYNVLGTIIDNKDANIDSLLKFRLLGIRASLSPLYKDFETIRNEKIMEYGTKDEKGEIFIDGENNPEMLKKFKAEMDKLTQSTVNCNISKIKYTEIIDRGLPADILVMLYDIIDGEN